MLENATGTVTDSTSVEDETVEAAPQEAMDDIIDNFTLDDLLQYGAEEDPLFADDAQHKGMKPINQWIQNVPEDVRKHLANIRADYTRKTQALSAAKKEVEQAKEQMRLQTEGFVNGPMARKLENIDTETEYDFFDAEGMKAEIQRQAQLMLKQMLQPAQEEIEVQQRRLALDKFKMENPEMISPEYRTPIVELLQSRPELKLEDAFYIVKAKIDSQKSATERAEFADRKARQKETVLKSSKGTKAQTASVPQFKSAIEAYNWHKTRQTF
jgi:hypothetical protein